ncbi:succinate dehydrogenase, hydrophobic membrane anchor protein [Agaribacterium haliotis]|uniref:succinate dehydrogenase, hydrophobic membrane anchor protein n=1 Tax=Agaribacterium haliotis TaxID=2013869 RepID=UPI000BB58E11|nr:succinate dehydrogenase, hydrophobic membrane anchor protein [Agaribacterium haliotis]
MVTAATSFSRSGLSDWILQRFTAVVLAAYTVFIVGYLVLNPNLDYATWSELFSCLWVRIFSLLTLVSIVAHGWIGLWVVLTDYVTSRFMGKAAFAIRVIVLSVYAVVNVVFLVCGVEIFWGI